MRVTRISDLEDRIQKKKTWIYGEIAAGRFPRPIKIGNSNAWVDAEIDAYLKDRIEERDRGAA